MATKLSNASLLLAPDYRYVVVRDVGSDAGIGVADALATPDAPIADSTDYEVLIRVAQPELKVRAEAEVWDTDPGSEPGWHAEPVHSVECPTGHLVISDFTGVRVIDFPLPAGAGVYAMRVLSRGRDEAVEKLRELVASDVVELPTTEMVGVFDQFAGIEQYKVQMWRTGDADEEDDLD